MFWQKETDFDKLEKILIQQNDSKNKIIDKLNSEIFELKKNVRNLQKLDDTYEASLQRAREGGVMWWKLFSNGLDYFDELRSLLFPNCDGIHCLNSDELDYFSIVWAYYCCDNHNYKNVTEWYNSVEITPFKRNIDIYRIKFAKKEKA